MANENDNPVLPPPVITPEPVPSPAIRPLPPPALPDPTIAGPCPKNASNSTRKTATIVRTAPAVVVRNNKGPFTQK